MKYEKMSEKLLPELVKTLFPKYAGRVESQKRLRGMHGELMIVDAYLHTGEKDFVFEFDGPTHYQQTKTQIRDQKLRYLTECCSTELIRIPYFAQFSRYDVDAYFSDWSIETFDLMTNAAAIDCAYDWGFHDTKIVYPSDFNQTGWKLFYDFYCSLAQKDKWTNMRNIYHSLIDVDDIQLTIGIDCHSHDEKKLFIEHYPT